MNTIQDLFQQAQLAEAAYANFIDPQTGLPYTSTKGITDALQDASNNMSFSDVQATEFVNNWKVVDHAPDLNSGFSATLFESLDNPGHYSLAIRGSTPANYSVDFIADMNLITANGIAIEQLVDLYNFWQRAKTPAYEFYNAAYLTKLDAETAAYFQAALGNDVTDPATNTTMSADAFIAALESRPGVFIDRSSMTVNAVQFGDSLTLADANLRLGSGSFVPNPASIDVSGHSLGGHLAMAFTRLVQGVNSNAISVNGLGFKLNNPNVDKLFTLLGGNASFTASSIQNVYGIEGPEFAAMNNSVLQQPGGWDGIFIESAGLGAKLGHSSSQMTDSLAVYDAFVKVAPSLNTDPKGIDTITSILKASSGNRGQYILFLY